MSDERDKRVLRVAVALTLVLGAMRLVAVARVGYGDSEALYASYALHPALAYLDHPGLVGAVMRALGGGGAPTPEAAHVLTTWLGLALPALFALAARAHGATRAGALLAALITLCVPELTVGLFGLTPDALLAPLWLLALAALGVATREKTNTRTGAAAWIAAGALASAATYAKISGALLTAAMLAHVATHAPTRRRIAPWIGALLGLGALVPLAAFESHHGWPMIVHRLSATQNEAGVSLRNVGAVLGGQLLYVGPVVVVLAVLGARHAWRTRTESESARVLWLTFAVPGGALLALSLWSRVAEPHWLAPAYLALAVRYAASPVTSAPRPLHRWAFGTGVVATALAYAWVLVPAAAQLRPDATEASYDIANELYGWSETTQAVKRAVAASPEGTVVAGPHWTICAQLRAALPPSIPVGCFTKIGDDFETWLQRGKVASAPAVVFVSDNRFGPDVPTALEHLARAQRVFLPYERGGRVVRLFSIDILRENPRSLACRSGT